jgi:ABC-2 type transport system ATP-binding protein
VFVSSHLLSEMAQMADNIVVIGKGKLIADTSMEKLVSESAASGAYVRSPQLEGLKTALLAEKLEVAAFRDGLKVAGATTDAVGEIAHRQNLPISELTAHTASLEEAFLELTAGSEEYISKTEVTK